MESVTFSELALTPGVVLQRVVEDQVPVRVERGVGEAVVMMPYAMYERWQQLVATVDE